MNPLIKNHFKFLLVFILIITFALFPVPFKSSDKVAEAAQTASQPISSYDPPLWLYIPSINLSSSIEGVGINNKGNMDVPSGRTNNVGWYKYGTLPGETGTAVLDAHNTAAFKNLHMLNPGSDIYVITKAGRVLHFTATETKTYPVATLSRYTLFEDTDAKQINLITCAGTLLGNGEASHRLIVSAQLAA